MCVDVVLAETVKESYTERDWLELSDLDEEEDEGEEEGIEEEEEEEGQQRSNMKRIQGAYKD